MVDEARGRDRRPRRARPQVAPFALAERPVDHLELVVLVLPRISQMTAPPKSTMNGKSLAVIDAVDRGQDGDLERCALRPGNVHSAHGWREVLDPVVARYRGQALRRLLRGDAAFALPDVYEYLVRSPRSGRRSYPGATRRQASDPNLVARSQKSLAK